MGGEARKAPNLKFILLLTFSFLSVVMEYVDGVQLFDKITEQENQTFTEKQAAVYMR